LRASSIPPLPTTEDPNRIRLGSNHPLTNGRSRSSSISEGSSSDETLVDPSSINPFGLSSSISQQPPWTQREVDDFLLSRTLKPTDVRPPEELVRTLRGNLGKLSEGLWILRPLIYVLALRRYTTRSYKPWLLSFLIELLSRYLFKKSQTLVSKGGEVGGSMMTTLLLAMMGNNPILNFLFRIFGIGRNTKVVLKPVSEVDGNEMNKRVRAFWWYAIRGPAWYGHTR